MRRWTRTAAVVASVAVIGACAPPTGNSSGVLDCPSETVEYDRFDRIPDAPGSPTPAGMLAMLSWDPGEQPGELRVESESNDQVVYVYTGADGNRLGRVVVIRADTGWFIQQTERCT